MDNATNQPTPLPPPTGRGSKPPTLWRSLGQFFGHVVAGAVKPVEGEKGAAAPGGGQIVRQEVQERTANIDGTLVKLRRTVIDEVELAQQDERGKDEAGVADARPTQR